MSNEETENFDSKESKSKKESEALESNSLISNLSDLEKNFDDLPDEAKAMLGMLQINRSSISTRSSSFLEDKINTEHISKILDIAEEDNKRELENIKLARLYNLINLVVVFIFLGFLTVFLANKDLSTYQDIIRIIIIFGGGFGAGFGYKSKMK